MLDIVTYIIKNKNILAQDAVLWMTEQYPNRTITPEKCIRDIKYVLDAYVVDINSGSSIQTINIGNNFWLNGVRQIKNYKVEIKVHRYLVNIIKSNVSEESASKIDSLLQIFCSILINGPIKEHNNISSVLQKYRYVREYDTSAEIDQSTVEKCIQTAWKNTPSKNNFMNYRVTVVGPDRQDLKDDAFNLCLYNECRMDSKLEVEQFWKERYLDKNIVPQFYNIKSCSYMLIFSQRLCPIDELNPWQQYSIDQGRYYEQCDSADQSRAAKGAVLESGLFASNLGALCLENGLDISHTLCMPWEPKLWKNFGIEKDPVVIFIMTIGKGLVYRRDHLEEVEKEDKKPDFHKVVQFL